MSLRAKILAPFPYFGGKRDVAEIVWSRFGQPKQYIEPFCGSAAILLAAPEPASLELINDASGFIANFWRATKHQPGEVAWYADYPVSHIDLGARHRWLLRQRERLAADLADADWPGDAKVAGWWLWGQCSWIGAGWAAWDGPGERCSSHASNAGMGIQAIGKIPHAGNAGMGIQAIGKIPHASDAGRGIQAIGKIPHASDAGRGIQAIGQIPHASDAGRGIQAIGQIPHAGNAGMGIQAIGQIPHAGNAGMGAECLLTSAGRAAWDWLRALATRLERVRIVHGDWTRCLNHHYGGNDTAVFLDPPYRDRANLYGARTLKVDEVAAWARSHASLRVALAGLEGDYEMPGWSETRWSRRRLTYSGSTTRHREVVWFSPACFDLKPCGTLDLFADHRERGML